MSKQDFYFLSPVLVMKVTNQNIDEVAEWCGGLVQETESRRVAGRMDKYVLVPTPKEAKVSWAFPGMFVTKRLVITMKGEIKGTWAVFRRDYFEKNYFETPEAATAATWEREHDEALKPKEEVTVNVSVGEALHDATLAKIQEIARKSGGNITINVQQEQLADEAEIASVLSEIEEDDNQPELPIEDVPALFEHNHLLEESCEAAGCEVDRYRDGEHFFTDKVVTAVEGQENVVRDRQPASSGGPAS